MRIRLILGLSLLVGATSAAAQDVPIIDGVGAYNHSQVMRHRDRSADEKRTHAPDAEELGHKRLMALSPEARRALIALKPELDRRVKRDGEVAANRWFESKVAEAEMREGLRP